MQKSIGHVLYALQIIIPNSKYEIEELIILQWWFYLPFLFFVNTSPQTPYSRFRTRWPTPKINNVLFFLHLRNFHSPLFENDGSISSFIDYSRLSLSRSIVKFVALMMPRLQATNAVPPPPPAVVELPNVVVEPIAPINKRVIGLKRYYFCLIIYRCQLKIFNITIWLQGLLWNRW